MTNLSDSPLAVCAAIIPGAIIFREDSKPVSILRSSYHLPAACLFLLLYGCPSAERPDSAGSASLNKEQGKLSPADSSASWALLPFVKADSVNPILSPGDNHFKDPILRREINWEEKDVFNPAIVVRGRQIYMFYRAQDKTGLPSGTSRIGLAVSADGFHFARHPRPILYPAQDAWKKYEWQGGCEDPRVVEDGNGVYYMMYTAFDGKMARLLVATSRDLVHWAKKGPVFARALGGRYKDSWSKSGSIVSVYQDGKIIASKIGGKYWMYWGDKSIWAAYSDDLINWTPLENAADGQGDGEKTLKIVLPAREGKFDSDLVEPGPPAMITEKGILLIYNSRNAVSKGDGALPDGTYTASQALFDRNDPTKMTHRMERYFVRPEKPYEITGQVNQVCFIEGLARIRGKDLLYYGTADSKIAVAVREVAEPAGNK